MTALPLAPPASRAGRGELRACLDTAHVRVRALASRLDLPGTLRARLHRIADDLLALLLDEPPPAKRGR